MRKSDVELPFRPATDPLCDLLNEVFSVEMRLGYVGFGPIGLRQGDGLTDACKLRTDSRIPMTVRPQ